MAQSFALGSPKANEPYNVESQIIQSMMSNLSGNDASRLGSMYLGNYWTERGGKEYDYNKQVQAQNQFAQMQAAEEAANNRQKNAIDLFGKSGGAQVIAGSPSTRQALAYDLAQPTIADVANVARQGELAKTLQAAGAGSNSLVQAGLPPSASGISSLIPQAGITQGVPLDLQKEAMQQAGANSRAASTNMTPRGTFTQGGGYDELGQPRAGMSVSVPHGNVAAAEDMFRRMQGSSVFNSPTYNASSASPLAPSANRGAGSPNTSAAPAGAGNTKISQQDEQHIQSQFITQLKTLERSNKPAEQAAYKDIRGAMGADGKVPFYQRKDGSFGMRGAQGQY